MPSSSSGLTPGLRQPRDDLPRAQARVHEQAAFVGRDERAVARAAAAQDGEGKHAGHNKPEI